MIRLFTALTAVLAAALAVAAAPAVTAPHRPDPVEREVQAPRGGLGDTSARGFVSRPVEAPIRFNVVGLNWAGDARPAIAVRVRAEGEPWGRWTPVPAESDGAPDPGTAERSARGVSQPVWAGEADLLQYRLSRRPDDLRLHFINTTGTATAADRVESAVRTAASQAATALTDLFSDHAGAATSPPRMISRERWAGDDCRPRRTPDYGKVRAAFVHHTVTANGYSRAEALDMVLGICRYHRNSNGWDDIGYQFLVDRFGRIYEGRDGGIRRAVVGAQVQGFNDQSTGIANLGTFSSKRQSGDGIRATARLIRWKLPHHGTPTQGRVTLTSGGGDVNPYPEGTRVRLRRISGHRDAGSTECPGEALYGQLGRVRRLSDVTAPDAPRRLTAASRDHAVRLNWRANDERDLEGYRVQRKKPEGGWRKVGTTRRNRFRDDGLRAGRRYTYRVRAFDDRNNVSEPSNEASALALPG